MSQASEKCALETGRAHDLSLISNSFFFFSRKKKDLYSGQKSESFLKPLYLLRDKLCLGWNLVSLKGHSWTDVHRRAARASVPLLCASRG